MFAKKEEAPLSAIYNGPKLYPQSLPQLRHLILAWASTLHFQLFIMMRY